MADKTFDKWLDEHQEWRTCPDLIVSAPTRDEAITEYPEVNISEYFNDDGQPYMMRDDKWVTIIAHYFMMRQGGSTHRFADMCASQRGPALMTDAIFFEGNKRLGDNFDKGYLDSILSAAKSQGFTPNPTDQYIPGLARFRGDKEAFVPASGGRGYIKRLCESRGWACDGTVEVKGRELENDPFDDACPLAPDLIAQNAQQFVQANPDEARKMTRTELRDHMVEKHGVTN